MKIMRNKTFQREIEAAEGRIPPKILEALKAADKIYLEPLTLVGDNQTINNCLFLGCKPDGIILQNQPDAPIDDFINRIKEEKDEGREN